MPNHFKKKICHHGNIQFSCKLCKVRIPGTNSAFSSINGIKKITIHQKEFKYLKLPFSDINYTNYKVFLKDKADIEVLFGDYLKL